MFYEQLKGDLEKYYKELHECQIKKVLKYSLEGGKCIRGFIVKHLINKISNNKIDIWYPIVAIELIHGVSLIIDDLPCMDNDKVRRNKPSTFVKFGERHAILVSLYGISEAFRLLFDGILILKQKTKIDDIEYIKVLHNIISEWSELIGKNLIVGQMLDLKENVEKLINYKVTNYNNKNIIIYKTCSLFIFTFLLGAIFSGEKVNLTDFKRMGYCFGIMFQIMDDFKDMNEDDSDINYILINGKNNSIQVYLEAKNELLKLLENNNILTIELLNLISIIDNKIPFE